MGTKGPKATSKFLCFLLRDRLVALALDVLRVGAGLLRLGVQQLVGLGAQGEVDVFADLCGNVTYEVSWKRTQVACGYPTGTHEKKVGNSMFRDTTPSKNGVYTFDKIAYEPSIKGKHTKKTGEVVYYRLVEESDVEAIKKAFPHLVF